MKLHSNKNETQSRNHPSPVHRLRLRDNRQIRISAARTSATWNPLHLYPTHDRDSKSFPCGNFSCDPRRESDLSPWLHLALDSARPPSRVPASGPKRSRRHHQRKSSRHPDCRWRRRKWARCAHSFEDKGQSGAAAMETRPLRPQPARPHHDAGTSGVIAASGFTRSRKRSTQRLGPADHVAL